MLFNPMASNLVVSMEMEVSHLTLGGTALSSTAFTPYEVAHLEPDVEAANIQKAYASMTEPSANRIDAGVRLFSPSSVDHAASVMKMQRYEIETMITLDYRASAWGVRRIALDAVSNHLPADSGGTTLSVRLKQNGRWVDLHDADRFLPTEEVVIEDDGHGYDAELLSILYSSKSSDEPSVGQFGEGLKMIAAAALRCGVALEYRSRNWVARPFVKHLTVGGRPIEKLCFEVTEKYLARQGSQTSFLRPPKELMDEIFDLPNQVLALNRTYKELYREGDAVPSWFETGEHQRMPTAAPHMASPKPYPARIIELRPAESNAEPDKVINKLFVKGVAVEQKIPALFSYDLGLENVTPDRWFVDQKEVLDAIESLLKHCTNPIVIDRVLDEAHRNPFGDCHEFRAFNQDRHGMGFNHDTGLLDKVRRLAGVSNKTWATPWTVAFKKFGENAVIASHDTNVNTDAEAMGFNPVQLNHSIAEYLGILGVPTADELNKEEEYRFIDPSELSDSEREFLARIPEINQWLLSLLPLQDQSAIDVKNIDVKIYSGLFLKSGREIESSMGVQITNAYGKKSIGIKRAILQDWDNFLDTYFHEFGHYVTGAADHERKFVGFFTRVLMRRASIDLGRKPT